jgi:hypothetical protein
MTNTTDLPRTNGQREPMLSADRDLASILSALSRAGVEDDVSRLMDVYESVERVYREASAAGTPVIGASSSANL